jgi:hypothetical protein
MGADMYTFTWTIDRPRYRSPIDDDTVHYRANAVSTVALIHPADG